MWRLSKHEYLWPSSSIELISLKNIILLSQRNNTFRECIQLSFKNIIIFSYNQYNVDKDRWFWNVHMLNKLALPLSFELKEGKLNKYQT